MENNSSNSQYDEPKPITINDEDFKRKVRALIRSREQLKTQNLQLKNQLSDQAGKVADLEKRISQVAEKQKKEMAARANTTPAPMVGLGDNAIYKSSDDAQIDYKTDDEDVKLNIGKVFLDAQASGIRIIEQSRLEAQANAQRIIDEARAQAQAIREENEFQSSNVIKNIKESKGELDAVKVGLEGIINSFSSRVDVINGILDNIEKRYNSN